MPSDDEELDPADEVEEEAEASEEADVEDVPSDLADGIEVVSAKIRPQALPYYVFVEIPRAPFDLRCRQYYRQHRAELEKLVYQVAVDPDRSARERKAATSAARAFRPGRMPQALVEQFLGRVKIYWPLLHAILRREVMRQHQDREILLFQDADLQEGDPQNYGLACYFFFVPLVTLPDMADAPIPDIEVVVRTPDEIAAQVERKIQAALVPVLMEEKQEPCGPGDGVVASLVASQDGKKIDYLDLRNQAFFTGQSSQIGDGIFLGLAAGESRVSKAPAPPGAQPGEIDLHVHVHAVYGARLSTPDEQATARGFESADDWRRRLTDGYGVAHRNAKRSSLRQTVDRHLRAIAEVGAVPSSWLTNKVMEAYGQLLQQHGTEGKTLLALHAADKDEVLNALTFKLLTDLEQTLLVREWGRRCGVEGDSSFENAVPYAETVWEWAEQHVPVTEISTATIEERRQRAVEG